MNKYILWLSGIQTISNKLKYKIIQNITPEKLYHMNAKELKSTNLFTDKQISAITSYKNEISLTYYLNLLKKTSTTFISIYDNNYPKKLAHLDTPPIGLFCRGKLPISDKPVIAIIGSRHPSDYGREVAYEYAYILSKYFTIISGLALGIDNISHIASMDSGGFTIGVLGCGVDICYPQNNFSTYMRMLDNASIISEFPNKTNPKSWHFPARNRIISGMADAIIVVEATEKSGTSLTVESALEQGKDVFAIPGRITDKNSIGCNKLIKDGAYLLNDYTDILNHFSIKKVAPNINATTQYSQILNIITSTPISIDELSILLNMDITTLSSLLLDMELKNLIKSLNNGFYIKNITF